MVRSFSFAVLHHETDLQVVLTVVMPRETLQHLNTTCMYATVVCLAVSPNQQHHLADRFCRQFCTICGEVIPVSPFPL